VAIDVYEYVREGKCVEKFTYTYACIRQMKIQTEEEDRHIGEAMCTSIGTVTLVSV